MNKVTITKEYENTGVTVVIEAEDPSTAVRATEDAIKALNCITEEYVWSLRSGVHKAEPS